MACHSTDEIQAWVEQAERSLYVLAHELRRIPLDDATRQLHVRALELKREVARWRSAAPDYALVSAVLDEIETLTRASAARRMSRR